MSRNYHTNHLASVTDSTRMTLNISKFHKFIYPFLANISGKAQVEE